MKEQIIKKLEDAQYLEDDFILKYDDPSIWTLLKSLPKEKFKKIEKLMKQNIKDSRWHSNATRELLEGLRGGKYEP